MALSSEIIAKLGLDSSSFSAGLRTIPVQVERIGQQAAGTLQRAFNAGAIFKGFLGGLGIGSALAIFNKLATAVSEAAGFADRLAEKFMEAASSARSASEAIARIGKSDVEVVGLIEAKLAKLKATRDALNDSGGSKSFLGGLVDRGSAVDKLMGFSRDEDLERAEKLKQLNQQIGATILELAGKKNVVEEKGAAIAKKSADEKAKVEKETTSELEKQKMTRQELVREANVAKQAAYDNYLLEQKKTGEIQKQLDALNRAAELKGKSDLVTESTLFAGGRAFGASRSARDLEQASSDALMEVIRRARNDIGFVEGTKGRGSTAAADAASGFIIQGSIIARLQTDIQRAQFQLDQRKNAEKALALGDPAAARRNFTGDPLEFDRFYQQNGKSLDENTAILRDVKGLLTQPLKVVSLNQISPFPR
jgi:hypothetical protein